MKVLFIFANNFEYKTTIKTLDTFPDIDEEKEFKNIQLAFIQMESADEDNLGALEKKIIKNIKWILKKNNIRQVILHSFAHLSESKASPEIAKQFFDKVESRLRDNDFEVSQTPFGYFLDLNIQAPGFSTARVFKSL